MRAGTIDLQKIHRAVYWYYRDFHRFHLERLKSRAYEGHMEGVEGSLDSYCLIMRRLFISTFEVNETNNYDQLSSAWVPNRL